MVEALPEAGLPDAALPDAVARQWLFRLAPRAAIPYLQLARLDRPAGYWLLVLPCWWSSALASLGAHAPPALGQLALFLVGAIVMRGSGSTYNDIADRELDAKVERTRHRPLASGRIGVGAAWAFLVAQALVGFAVVVCFNLFTVLLGIGSLGIVAVYPFMKRFSSWPQLVLGLAFAWGGLVGWSARFAALAPAAVAVYAAAIAWTIGYDTIYALQDRRDDAAAGIRSTARLFGERVGLAVGLFYAAAAALAELALVLAAPARPAMGLAQLGVAGFAAHLAWQVVSLRGARASGADGDRRAEQRALQLFRSNRDAGLILFCCWFAAAALPLGGTLGWAGH